MILSLINKNRKVGDYALNIITFEIHVNVLEIIQYRSNGQFHVIYLIKHCNFNFKH